LKQEEILNFIQQIYIQLFEDDINEKDAENEFHQINSAMDADYVEDTNPQLSTGLGQELICPNDDKVSKLLNEEIINLKYNDKIIRIKNKLIKSFCEKIDFKEVKNNEINFKSLENIIKYIRIYEENILISHKKEIIYFVKIGKLIKHIKILHPTNWQIILKKNKISYSVQYLNFLIMLFNLFTKYKILYKSTLSLSFFKKNFIHIKTILNNGEL